MALSKDIYSAFEDVVGPEYICADPASCLRITRPSLRR